MAAPLVDLSCALEEASAASGPARMQALDAVAVRFARAIAPFLAEPAAMLPAQRALLLMPGRPGPGGAPDDSLAAALRRADVGLGPFLGGFSRLLDNALSAGQVLDSERLRPSGVEAALAPLAHSMNNVARELSALDDLSHALSTPAELAAGAVVVTALFERLDPAPGELAAWLAHRGLDERLLPLLSLRPRLTALRPTDVPAAAAAGVARPFALWLLAHRLAARQRLEQAEDREALDALLTKARLLPLEVFDVVGLWPELMDD